MRRRTLLVFVCALAAAAGAFGSGAAAAQDTRGNQLGGSPPPEVGAIEHMQVTSITRQAAAIWLRTVLARAPEGSRATFTGDISIANVPLPIHPPLVVALQHRPGRIEAVFNLTLKLSELPQELLGKIGTQSLDLEIQGTLKGSKGGEAPVYAVGLLRYGTKDIDAAYGAVADFVKLGGARLTGVSLSETTGEARVLIYDPFGFAIPIRAMTYSLIAKDQKICGGELKATRIHPGRENEIRIPLTARNTDLLAAAGNAVASGGTIDGRLVGAITFKVAKGDITLPIDLPGKIQLKR